MKEGKHVGYILAGKDLWTLIKSLQEERNYILIQLYQYDRSSVGQSIIVIYFLSDLVSINSVGANSIFKGCKIFKLSSMVSFFRSDAIYGSK